MKVKYLFTCLLCTFSMAAQAQTAPLEYEPMAQERRIWDIQVGGIKENRYRNYILGDTLINGDVWKKVYGSTLFGSPSGTIWQLYHMAMRDVGKKVYVIAKGSNKPRLLYDFGLQVGETVRCGMEGNAFACLLDKDEPLDTLFGFPINFTLRVDRIDVVRSYLQERRRFTLTLLDVYKHPMITNIVWDEGVGSSTGLFSPWMLFSQDFARLECYFDDEDEPSLTTKVVGNNQPLPSESSNLFNLLGRRLPDTPQNEVYIRDGKKYVEK